MQAVSFPRALSSRPYHCVKMKENFDERSELTLCEESQKNK